MANLQLLLKSGLILIIATVLSTSKKLYNTLRNDDEAHGRLWPYPQLIHYRLLHYDIELTLLNFENTTVNYFNFFGKCKFYLNFTGANVLQLYAGETIEILNSSVVKQDQPEINVPHHLSTYKASLAVLRFLSSGEHVLEGIHIVTLTYKGTAYDNKVGLFRTSYIQEENKRWLLATNFPLLGAHRVFPCFDEPTHRATFNISINCDQKYQVMSNMPLNYQETNNVNNTYLHKAVFDTTPKLYPKLVGFIVYDFLYKYTIHPIQKQTHSIYFRYPQLHTRYATKLIEDFAAFFNDDWRKVEEIVGGILINYVLIPGFPFDSKDNWKLIYFREESVIYDKQLDPFARKIEVARLISRTVAHQIFGNLVSPHVWWTNEWLNDGIAVFFGIDAVNKIYSNTRMWELFVVQDLHDSLRLDPYIRMKPLNTLHFYDSIDHEIYYGFYRYLKAPALLRMLHYIITDEVFRNGTHLYLKTHQYRSATVDDFWAAMQTALDDLNKKKLFDLNMTMNTWLNDNYPLVNVITHFNKTSGNLHVNISEINIEHFLASENLISENEKISKWWIPITWFTDKFSERDINDFVFKKIDWISPNVSKKLSVNTTNGLIFVNANRMGYYRVNYDVHHWQRIAKYLSSSSYVKIPVLTRAQLIDDAFHLMVHQKLDSKIFWKLTNYFKKETDYIAWYPMIKALEYMSPIFSFINERSDKIKEHMGNILNALLKKLGYNTKSNKDNLTNCLIQEAAKWACILGVSACKKYATDILQWHLENRKEHKLLPWWEEWTYCRGLVQADNIIWHSVLNLWKNEHDHTVLKHLMCSEDYYILVQMIAILSKNNIATPQFNENVHIFLFFLSMHSKEYLLEDILDNFLDILPNAATEVAALNIIINHIYSKEQFKQVEEFVHNKWSNLNSTVHYKIQKRTVEIENHLKYLKIISK